MDGSSSSTAFPFTPDDHGFFAVNLLLILVRRVLDFLLNVAVLESLDHTAQGFNLSQVFVGAGFDLVRQGPILLVGTRQRSTRPFVERQIW